MGLPLPDELVELTFNHLDVPSLLRCMQVCKLFHAIITESTQLSYKIELFASCMEDNEHSSMDTVSRLSILRKYNRVWNDMEWSSSGFIPMCDGHCWEFSAGILAQSTHDNGLFLVQLPCALKGIAERRWSIQLDFRVRDFTLDNSQDLIVLLELTSNFTTELCKAHIRTFSGEHHPCAAVPQLTQALENPRSAFSYLMQICGDHLAVLFDDQLGVSASSQNFLVVWNWRTGHQKVYIRAPEFQSFAFMTEDLILAGILKTSTEITLRVLSITACTEPVHSLADMPYVYELQYPELLASTEFFLIRSEPSPSWRPPASSGVPFYCSRKNFIFTISMRSFLGEIHESAVLFVPLSTLLSEVERSHGMPRRSVSWSEWGPSGTRILCREPSEIWVCYTYGMKFIQGLRWKNGARAYDFNPYAAKKYVKTKHNPAMLWKRLVALSKTQSDIFEEEVTTMLPGRVAAVTLEHSDGGWDAIMIGEDHILMVQPTSGTYGYMAM